jgi:hypothetical protein
MVDKINPNENIKKHDLELILEVNKKAIEIETSVVEQNEEIIEVLTDIRKTQMEVNETAIEVKKTLHEKNKEITASVADIRKTQIEHDLKMDKLIKQSEETNRDIFKIQVLFLTGLLSLIIQIIQIFIVKK